MISRHVLCAAVCTLGLLHPAALHAQSDEPINPLAGPSSQPGGTGVDGSSEPMMGSSLIEHTFDGRVVGLGAEPVRRILERLSLTEKQTDAMEAILIERNLVLAQLTQENYAMLLELGAAASSGEFEQNPLVLAQHLDRLAVAFHDFFRRGSLLTEMGDVLSPTQKWRAMQTLGQYRRAQIEERRRLQGDKRNNWELLTEIRFEEFGKRIEQSFESRVAVQQDEFEVFIRYLLLTPEQVAEVVKIYEQIGTKEFLGEEVSGAEQLQAYTQLHGILTPEQQAKVRKLFLAGGRIEDVMSDH